MSKAARLSMCPHCGRLFPATANVTTPSHFDPVKPGEEFGSLCPGSFDVGRNPWHDRRKLYNGEAPPTQEQVAAFAGRNGAKK